MANKIIDEAEVRLVAKLARLELEADEVSRFSTQLSAILEYIEKLNELDTDGVEPLAHCLPIHNVFRPDIVHPSLGADKALSNAPLREGEFFVVPRILDEASA